MLGCNEQVRDEAGKPVGERNDIIVPVLFVHGDDNLCKFGVNRRVVQHAPVEEGIDLGALGNEFCRTAHRHHSNVLCDEIGRGLAAIENSDNFGHLAVRACVIVA